MLTAPPVKESLIQKLKRQIEQTGNKPVHRTKSSTELNRTLTLQQTLAKHPGKIQTQAPFHKRSLPQTEMSCLRIRQNMKTAIGICFKKPVRKPIGNEFKVLRRSSRHILHTFRYRIQKIVS